MQVDDSVSYEVANEKVPEVDYYQPNRAQRRRDKKLSGGFKRQRQNHFDNYAKRHRQELAREMLLKVREKRLAIEAEEKAKLETKE